MSLTFREKSLWLVAGSLVVVYGLYFAWALPGHGPRVLPRYVVAFVAAAVLLVLLQIVGHIVLAITDRHTDTDERGRQIALRGARNGYFVLAVGVFVSICLALLSEGNFLFTHVLLAFWVLAELVDAGSQLILHRRWG
jgi:hypothetical protein